MNTFSITSMINFKTAGKVLSSKKVFGTTNIFITTTISMIGIIKVDRKLLFLYMKAETAALPIAVRKIGLLNIDKSIFTKLDQVKELDPTCPAKAKKGEV